MATELRVTDDAPAAVAGELTQRGATSERAERWRLPRDGYRPTATVVRDDEGRLVAAVLTTARPATAATKIVDLWAEDERSADDVIDRVVADARARGDVALKWEVPDGIEPPASLQRHGFVAMRRPWSAVGTESVQGFVRWLEGAAHDEPGYYAQTTLFTCGAVAAMIAAEHRGGGFRGDDGDRDRELAFWRRASNYPACEPIGLAVALHSTLRDAPIEVALDLDGPALLEGYTGFDHDFRAELQDDSLRQARAGGIPVRRDRVEIAEIARRVAEGERALLLIDEAPMHGEAGPHWVVAHARAGATIVIEDPWINTDAGETWVDTHELPVPPADLDRLVRWGAEGYRGVIFADVDA